MRAMLVRPSSFFFSSRRRHTRFKCDWSSDVCSSDLAAQGRWTVRPHRGRHVGKTERPLTGASLIGLLVDSSFEQLLYTPDEVDHPPPGGGRGAIGSGAQERSTMKRVLLISAQIILLALGAGAAAEPDWSAVDKVFGGAGKSLLGGVYRFGWPRTDMNVTIGGVKVEAGLALGSRGAFLPTGKGEEVMTMGDLVLLHAGATPGVAALQAGGVVGPALRNRPVIGK